MTEQKFTSAGRLVTEIHRIRARYAAGNEVFQHLEPLFGGEGLHWSSGLSAFSKLVDRVGADLIFVPETRRPKFVDALNNINQAVSPHIFHHPSTNISKQFLTELNIERVESIDDLLGQAGRSVSVDQERARIVRETLDEVIDDIKTGEPSEIDAFLIEKLSELRFILDHYALFGPEGVKDAIAVLVGSISIENIARGGLSKDALKSVRGVFRVVKGALDVLVYGQSGVDAIEWAGHGLAGLLEG